MTRYYTRCINAWIRLSAGARRSRRNGAFCSHLVGYLCSPWAGHRARLLISPAALHVRDVRPPPLLLFNTRARGPLDICPWRIDFCTGLRLTFIGFLRCFVSRGCDDGSAVICWARVIEVLRIVFNSTKSTMRNVFIGIFRLCRGWQISYAIIITIFLKKLGSCPGYRKLKYHARDVQGIRPERKACKTLATFFDPSRWYW